VVVVGLPTFPVWLGIELDTVLVLGLQSGPRTGLRYGLFGFPDTTAGDFGGSAGGFGLMFVLEGLRLGPVWVSRVAANRPTDLLGVITDEFGFFIVGFVPPSELETLLLWPFGVLGPPARGNLLTSPGLGDSGSRRESWYLSTFWLDFLWLSPFGGRGNAVFVLESLLESAFLADAGLCSWNVEPSKRAGSVSADTATSRLSRRGLVPKHISPVSQLSHNSAKCGTQCYVILALQVLRP
jgi:hypothetical protein